MKQGRYILRQKRQLTENVWELRLAGDASPIIAPGQFVNIRVGGCFLRRPISVCHWDGESLTIIFRTVGKGTAALAEMRTGESVDLLCGLGNGFDLPRCGDRTLLLGGGLGAAPLYGLAKALLETGKKPMAVLGFNTKNEIFYEEEFRALGVDITITTVDGSAGIKGFVTDALPDGQDSFCACGPLPMMKAVYAAVNAPGQFSLEERMGCGFGACMGCSIETRSGSKRVCRDGPVFEKEELLW